jgi:hypothetical protein
MNDNWKNRYGNSASYNAVNTDNTKRFLNSQLNTNNKISTQPFFQENNDNSFDMFNSDLEGRIRSQERELQNCIGEINVMKGENNTMREQINHLKSLVKTISSRFDSIERIQMIKSGDFDPTRVQVLLPLTKQVGDRVLPIITSSKIFNIVMKVCQNGIEAVSNDIFNNTKDAFDDIGAIFQEINDSLEIFERAIAFKSGPMNKGEKLQEKDKILNSLKIDWMEILRQSWLCTNLFHEVYPSENFEKIGGYNNYLLTITNISVVLAELLFCNQEKLNDIALPTKEGKGNQ